MDPEVTHFLESYPPPSPPEKSPEEIFSLSDFRDVDKRARQASDDLVNDFNKLTTYLQKGTTSDLAKVRSIFIWLSAQRVLSTDFSKVEKPGTPRAWLKRIKYDRSYYAELFAILCRNAGVPCAIIEGSTKGAGFEVGRENSLKVTSRWNAVHVQGSWQLVNVAWALINTDGIAEGEWIKVETTEDQAVRESEVAKKEVTQELDEFWFLTKPADFSAFCHPRKAAWQLLDHPWTDQQFLDTPRFAQDFFPSKWELVTENKGVLVANQGTCKIAFVHPITDIKYASLTYNLYFNTKQSPKPLPDDFQLERYVTVGKKLGEKSLLTRLPQAGVYRVEVAGILDDTLTPLGEFRIECPKITKRPPPLPEGCEDIGYSETAVNAGLLSPSHEDGVVIARPGEKMDFSFKTPTGRQRPRVQATLTHNTLPSDQLGKVEVKQTDIDVTVSLTVPKNTNECGLCIDVLHPTPNQTQAIDYESKNIINYLLTEDEKLKCPEENAIIKAKMELLKSIKNRDPIRFQQSYAAFKNSSDPMLQATISDFFKELDRISGEKRRAVTEAMNGSEVPPLDIALAEYEVLGALVEVDQDCVQQARAMLELLTALQSGNVQMLEKGLRAVANTRLNGYTNVQKAEDTLIDIYEKDLTEALHKRTLEALEAVVTAVERSCLGEKITDNVCFLRAKEQHQSLKELKQVTDRIGGLSTKDMKKMAGSRNNTPHPHTHSVLMATFILLGEKEADLWKWEVIHNLLERRSEKGVAHSMAKLDINTLDSKQVDLAEGHVRTCQLDVLQAENANTALFFQWVQGVTRERRARDAVKQDNALVTTNN